MSAIEMSGRLEGLRLGDLMKMIRTSRRTGTLQLDDDGQHGTIEFLDGKIVRAQASWDYDSLGSLLLERGAISEEQLLEAIEHKRAHDLPEPIGRVLIELGVVAEETVRESMRLQVDRVVGQLMRIEGGTFQFQPDRDSADEITQDVGEVLRELSVTVESGMPSFARSAGAPTPDARLGELKADVLTLRKAGNKAELVTRLTDVLGRYVERLVLLERRKDGLHAVEARGTDTGGLVLARKDAGPLWNAGRGAVCAATADEKLRAWHERVGAPRGRSCLIVGLAGLGRPNRVIYADQGASPDGLPCLDHVELLVLEAELLAETVTARAGKRRKKN